MVAQSRGNISGAGGGRSRVAASPLTPALTPHQFQEELGAAQRRAAVAEKRADAAEAALAAAEAAAVLEEGRYRQLHRAHGCEVDMIRQKLDAATEKLSLLSAEG